MLDHNQIRDLDDHALLDKIAEESSEVIKAAMKQAAHGPTPVHNGIQYDNARDVRVEFHQLATLVEEFCRRWP